MSYKPISDYGIIGDLHSAALVATDGSIDWYCLPRFDGAAVFGRILDDSKGGYFQITPLDVRQTSRRYFPATNVLETTFTTGSGTAVLTDFMPVHDHPSRPNEPLEVTEIQRIVRILQCTNGSVEFNLECFPRFDYGTIVPHAVLSSPHTGTAHGGAEAVSVYCSAPLEEINDGFQSKGLLREGDKLYAAVTNQVSFSHDTAPLDIAELELEMSATVAFWEEWSSRCTFRGEFSDDVLRSALTLKALTYVSSGALVAAATTSLPETIGGSRNWDYRFTWLRDATFALYALSIIGYTEEAAAFKDWLEWSTAGRARDLQVMYGLGGERRLTEIEIPELDGYRGSRPVRVGNAAYSQYQLDIYGEVLDSAHILRKFGGDISEY